MIVANMATYPPRRDGLVQAARRLAPQVDWLNIVLNEYQATLPELKNLSNVQQIIPETDTKDCGKFYPDISGASLVLLVDDDLIYPEDYVARTVERFEVLGPGHIGAYHASIYQKPKLRLSRQGFKRWWNYSPERIADYRRVITFYSDLSAPVIVDQVASGVAIARPQDLPPYSFIDGSQKYVDVRLARWCFERSITPVALAKQKDWITPIRYEETIYRDFTKTNPRHVSDEIMTYAYKIPRRGLSPKVKRA